MDGVHDTSALIFEMLPQDLIALIVVALNGGPVKSAQPVHHGFLHPGFCGGRELHYLEISRNAMTFWQHVCKHLRWTYTVQYSVYSALLHDHMASIETWSPPWEEYCCEDDWQDRDRFVPRHLFAGSAKPWMALLCDGPQDEQEAVKLRDEEEAKEAKRNARKAALKRQATAQLAALPEGRQLRPRRA